MLQSGLTPSRDTFIYEYVGDVVNSPSFYKRMRQYAEEGIRHFYFMMLQKDEVRLGLYIVCIRQWGRRDARMKMSGREDERMREDERGRRRWALRRLHQSCFEGYASLCGHFA